MSGLRVRAGDQPFPHDGHADVDPALFMDLAKVGQTLCRFLPQPEGERG